MRHAFRIVNVFTLDGDPFSGNPLCVFPEARGLDDATMQALARQMNLSETTFVLPSERDGHDARVRIFTPAYEMPFAGHPMLGTAFVLGAGAQERRFTLETEAGSVPVTVSGNRCTLQTARDPETREPTATRSEIAEMIGLPASAVCGPPLWVDTGVEQLVVPIASAALVRAARPSPELLARHGFGSSDDEAMAYLFATEGKETVVRFFFTQHGAVIEDPATGSACANLGGYWLTTSGPGPHSAKVRQGDAVGRPSRLFLEVDEAGRIFVAGEVLLLGEGSITLPDA
jgi:trans-2,3-dihydro-3-hydroxyanthranilate isomerase